MSLLRRTPPVDPRAAARLAALRREPVAGWVPPPPGADGAPPAELVAPPDAAGGEPLLPPEPSTDRPQPRPPQHEPTGRDPEAGQRTAGEQEVREQEAREQEVREQEVRQREAREQEVREQEVREQEVRQREARDQEGREQVDALGPASDLEPSPHLDAAPSGAVTMSRTARRHRGRHAAGAPPGRHAAALDGLPDEDAELEAVRRWLRELSGAPPAGADGARADRQDLTEEKRWARARPPSPLEEDALARQVPAERLDAGHRRSVEEGPDGEPARSSASGRRDDTRPLDTQRLDAHRSDAQRFDAERYDTQRFDTQPADGRRLEDRTGDGRVLDVPQPAVSVLDRWRGARLDPGRRGVAALALLALVAACLAGTVVLRARPEPVVPPAVSAPGTPVPGSSAAAAAPPVTEVVVAVAGKVPRPGLVRLPAGSRVADAVAAAGGAAPDADLTALNLARRLSDGEQVLVGVPAPPTAAGAPAAAGAVGPDALLDLNTATLQQFDALPGIGPVLAQKILDWRTEHGRFGSVDQLREVSGIGEAKYAEIESKVRV